MRYLAVQKLMQQSRWQEALVLAEKINESHPEDADIRNLVHVCRTMLQINRNLQEEDSAAEKQKVTASDYFSVCTIRSLRRLSSLAETGLARLPEKWQRLFQKERFDNWTRQLDAQSQPEKEWMWDVMFWDPQRRKILFSVTVGILFLLIVIFIWIAWPQKSGAAEKSSLNATTVQQKSQYFGEKEYQAAPNPQSMGWNPAR